ncbi:MAG TPA: mannosyltransferase family protein [Candidatus Acidoferrales bacterium]|nr:mannosyltransferase family protein [Candidatus Acidoferrales bacterium]
MTFLLLFFIIWRAADFIIASVTNLLHLANTPFAYGFTPYHTIPYLTQYLVAFANFDGAHYLHIAHDGYMQYEQTFFPLYPLIIHFLTPVFGSSYLLTGFVISNLSFFFGLYFFKKYLELLGKKPKTILWIFLLLITFPTSFFFGAVYTEGLFFLLTTVSLYFAQKKEYIKLITVAILISLTRLIGIFLFIPLLAILLEGKNLNLKQASWKKKINALSHYIFTNKRLVFISLSPLIGLVIYMIYLYFTTGDILDFYHAQAAFNNGRAANHLILLPQVYYRYLKILFTAAHDTTYFVSVVEFVTFTLFLIVLLYDLWKLWRAKPVPGKLSLIGLNLFSLINLLLPTFTGTLTSTPRYLLLSLSFFIRIAEIKNVIFRISLVTLFIIFHIILLSLFIQGYFVG